MHNKNHNKTASVKRFESEVADIGSIISGDTGVNLHHVIGERAYHNKIHIGVWWILPVSPAEHDMIDNDEGRKELEAYYQLENPVRFDLEKYLYIALLDLLPENIVPVEVFEAIQAYRR